MRALSVIAVVLVIAGCGRDEDRSVAEQQSPPILGARGPTDQEVVSQVRAKLEGLVMFTGDRCSDAFQIGEIQIVDRRTSGDTAQVITRTSITPVVQPCGPISCKQIARCYISRPELWVQGQPLNVESTYSFRRWDSGWRLASDADLMEEAILQAQHQQSQPARMEVSSIETVVLRETSTTMGGVGNGCRGLMLSAGEAVRARAMTLQWCEINDSLNFVACNDLRTPPDGWRVVGEHPGSCQ